MNGIHPTAVCDQATDLHEEEVPGANKHCYSKNNQPNTNLFTFGALIYREL